MASISAPLSSSAFANSALLALSQSTQNIALSTARLSSGNRLQRAGDDVAALALSSRLQSQIAGARQAQSNIAQGSSLLQVAAGSLSDIKDILTRMKSLATQANSASISSSDRTLLQVEFSQLFEQIDSTVGSTTFNNLNLLDGTFSGQNRPRTTVTAASKGTASLAFTAIAGGNTVRLNGAVFTAGTDFAVGGDVATSVENLKNALNASTNTAVSGASYTRSGNSLVITAKAGGELSNQYVVNQATSTATFTTAGGITNAANVYTLASGADNGIGTRSTRVAAGTIGDSLVNTQAQTAASVTLNVTSTISNGETLRIDDGNGGYRDFTFATVAATSTEIQIGSSIADTLKNAVKTISQYSGTDDFGVRQLEVVASGNSLTITNRNVGNTADLAGSALDVAETLANGSLTGASLNNGTNTGVNVSGVINPDFTGEIQGFTATYVGADSLNASLTVGESTYTAAITDTTVGSNTTARFSSTNGGYFDVQLASGQGTTVTNQSTADTFAARLNAAFSTLSFSQERIVSNYSGTGILAGSEAKLQTDEFTDFKIQSVNVDAPVISGGDAIIEVVANGETFRSASGIGGSLGGYNSLKLTSTTDANKVITVTNAATSIDFSTDNAAEIFQTALRNSFGLNASGSGLDFQIGQGTQNKVSVAINNSTADALFDGATPDISTQNNAEDAQDVIDAALQQVNSNLANVGSLQERFDIASSVLGTTIQGLDTTRAILADTDIVTESTFFAQETLKANAAIAVLAQVGKLQSGLLKAIEF